MAKSNQVLAGNIIIRPDTSGDATSLSKYPDTGYNYEKVNEESHDSDSTYVLNNLSASHVYDLYHLDDTSQSGIINSVTVSIVCRGTSVATNKKTYVATKVKTGGTEYAGEESSALSTSYSTTSTQYNNNPGGGAWTWDQINALQSGPSIRVEKTGDPGYCTQVYITIDYSPTITVSGTSDMTSGTVAVAVGSSLQTDKTGTIQGDGSWSISNVAQPSADDIITVWVDGAAEADEATGVAKYSGSGDMTGMVLNRHTLSVGGVGDQSLSVTEVASYTNSSDEDVMPGLSGSVLTVDGGSSYTDEEIEVLSSDTLTVGSSETLTTHHLTITGTLTSTTTAAYNVAGTWTNNGTFTQASSTVTLNGSAAQTISGTTETAFYNLTVSNTSAAIAVSTNFSVASGGTLTMNASAVLNPGAAVIISGAGTLTGSGTVNVTRTSATADFSSQYTVTNKTLTNLTVDYTGTGQVLSDLTYGNLTISGTDCITTGTNTATVGGAFTVSSTFTPSAGTMTFNNGASIVNTGTLTFQNITVAASATVTTSASFSIAGTLTVGSSANFSPSGGTITMATTSAAITNSGGTLTFNNLTINETPTSQDQYNASFGIDGTLTIAANKTFAPSGGTITRGVSSGGWSTTVNSGATLIYYNVTYHTTPSAQPSTSFSVANNLTVDNGVTLAPTSGTITMTGGSIVNNGGATTNLVFNNLTISGTTSTSSDFTVNGTLDISGGNLSPSGGTITMATTSWAITNSGTLVFNGLTISETPSSQPTASFSVGGVFTVNAGVTLAPTSGTITMTGGSIVNNGSLTFYNLTVSGSTSTTSTFGISNDLTVNGTLTVSSGTGLITLNGNITGSGIMNLTAGTFQQVITADKTFGSSSNANNWTFNNLKFNNSSGVIGHTITPNAGTGQIIIGGTLTLGDSGTQTITFDNESSNDRIFDLNDNFTVASMGIFSASSTQSFTIDGNYTNNGVFTANSGTVTFTAASDTQTIDSSGASVGSFHHLQHTGAGTLQLISALDVNGNFSQSVGTFDCNSQNQNFAGNFSLSNGTSYQKGGILTFDGSALGLLTDNTSGQDLGIIVIDGSSKTLATNTDFKSTTLTIGADDELDISSDTLTILGSGTPFTITAGGTFTVPNSTVVYAGSSATSITTTAYNHLTFYPSSGTPTYSLSGDLTSSDALTGNLTINSGATLDTTGNNYNITLAGSWDNNGTFIVNSSTVTFNATSIGKTIEAGSSSFNNIIFNSSSGGWTIQTNNLTATNDLTVTDTAGSGLTINGVTVEVQGTYSIADAETDNTIWTSATLYLNSASAYTIGSKNQSAETYDTLQIGVDTDIRLWNSTANTFTVAASGSLYSQNHANNNGDLYIWGDYHTQANDYWSYETDFDGTDISGSPRQVDVRIDPSSSVTVDNTDTLTAIGVSGNQTTVSRQGASGGYSIIVSSGGTIDFQYVDFDYLEGTTGLNIQSGANVTSLDYTGFDNLVGSVATDDAYITLASSVIGSNSKTITGINFEKTDTSVDFNVNCTGSSDTGYWLFSSGSGDFYGEDYDGANGINEDDPGMLRWDDSNHEPLEPTSLETENQTNPTYVLSLTPNFSAIYNDDDISDTATHFQIEVDDDPLFGSPIWDSEKTSLSSNCNQGNRCEEITYNGPELTRQIIYYWKIKFWDIGGLEGSWSTEEAYFQIAPSDNDLHLQDIRVRDLRFNPSNN